MAEHTHPKKTEPTSDGWLARKFKAEPIAGLSLLVAIAALWISNQTYRHTLDIEKEERAIVLVARFGDTTDKLTVAPADAGFHFQSGLIEFPNAIADDSQPIMEDGSVRGMGSVHYRLNDWFFKRIHAPKDTTVIVEAPIPLIVTSVFAVKGRRYVDRSLYFLNYTSAISDNSTQPQNPKFTGFGFATRFEEGGLPEPNLDDLFATVNKGWIKQ